MENEQKTDNSGKYKTVLNELFSLCTDNENKPGDRIAAAKLLLEYIRESADDTGDIRIVFDNIDEAMTE